MPFNSPYHAGCFPQPYGLYVPFIPTGTLVYLAQIIGLTNTGASISGNPSMTNALRSPAALEHSYPCCGYIDYVPAAGNQFTTNESCNTKYGNYNMPFYTSNVTTSTTG